MTGDNRLSHSLQSHSPFLRYIRCEKMPLNSAAVPAALEAGELP